MEEKSYCWFSVKRNIDVIENNKVMNRLWNLKALKKGQNKGFELEQTVHIKPNSSFKTSMKKEWNSLEIKWEKMLLVCYGYSFIQYVNRNIPNQYSRNILNDEILFICIILMLKAKTVSENKHTHQIESN